jgi:hypothetical protein
VTTTGPVPSGPPETGGGSTAQAFNPGLVWGGILTLLAAAALLIATRRKPRRGEDRG